MPMRVSGNSVWFFGHRQFHVVPFVSNDLPVMRWAHKVMCSALKLNCLYLQDIEDFGFFTFAYGLCSWDSKLCRL